MRNILGRGKFALLALLWLAAADARELRVEARRIDAGAVEADAVTLTLRWADAADSGEIELRAKRLAWADAGYAFDAFLWRCPLRRGGDGWLCEGSVRAAGPGEARLRLELGARTTLRLSRQRGSLQLSQDAADGRWQVDAQRMPADWLQPLLQAVWPEARLTGGTIDSGLQLQLDGAAPRLAGRLSATGLGLDTADGRIAAAGLGLDGRLDLRFGEPFDVDARFALQGGELLVGPLYAALPPTPVQLDVVASHAAGGDWRLSTLHWQDGDTLLIDGSAVVRPGADRALRTLQLRARSGELAQAQPRYLDGLLGSLGGSGIGLRGSADIEAAFVDAGWSVDATLQRLEIEDERGRFGVSGGNGELRWSQGDEPKASRFTWAGAALHGIPLGPAALALSSREGGFSLSEPASVVALGGSIAMRRFDWRPARGERSPELDLALELQSLDLSQLAARFGWPPFRGELSGQIPAARYEGSVLSFDGGLQVDVFDGRVEVGELRLERPFGVAPRLQADITLDRLDLQPLTAAFGFGEITGRLNGRIADLRLIDWEPVAFDARLRTADGKYPRKISQRAVSDLTSIGGGGLVGGIQAQMLKMFDSFSYSAIGLNCRLQNEVCEMGGLDDATTGYTVVEGAGLPRIKVVGFQRRVDWPVLVSRLKAVTDGQAVRFD